MLVKRIDILEKESEQQKVTIKKQEETISILSRRVEAESKLRKRVQDNTKLKGSDDAEKDSLVQRLQLVEIQNRKQQETIGSLKNRVAAEAKILKRIKGNELVITRDKGRGEGGTKRESRRGSIWRRYDGCRGGRRDR